jgi:hypothetical protein
MNVLVLAKRREEVSLQTMQPHFTAEIQAIWDLYAQGICREFYSRADQPGPAVLMLECASVEDAKKALVTLPLVELNLIDLDIIPLAPFTGFTSLFQPKP